MIFINCNILSYMSILAYEIYKREEKEETPVNVLLKN